MIRTSWRQAILSIKRWSACQNLSSVLSEYLGIERKVIDLAMKHLKEDSKVTSPK